MSEHLLPPNASAQERGLSLAIDRAADVAVPIRDVWNAQSCPSNMLAWLAWAFSVDEWDTSWTDEQKRAYIQQSMALQKYKGTIGAVQDALSALFVGARVQEWFNQIPAGDPYTFKVLLQADQVGISQQSIQSLFAVIERTKNLRSHMQLVQVIATTQAAPAVACCAAVGSEIVIPASEYQFAQFITGFAEADDLLDQITNTDLPTHLEP